MHYDGAFILEAIFRVIKNYSNHGEQATQGGVVACEFVMTKNDGEIQFGTNHLVHFLLNELLLEDLKKSTQYHI